MSKELVSEEFRVGVSSVPVIRSSMVNPETMDTPDLQFCFGFASTYSYLSVGVLLGFVTKQFLATKQAHKLTERIEVGSGLVSL